jgi:hypothetical protein
MDNCALFYEQRWKGRTLRSANERDESILKLLAPTIKGAALEAKELKVFPSERGIQFSETKELSSPPWAILRNEPSDGLLRASQLQGLSGDFLQMITSDFQSVLLPQLAQDDRRLPKPSSKSRFRFLNLPSEQAPSLLSSTFKELRVATNEGLTCPPAHTCRKEGTAIARVIELRKSKQITSELEVIETPLMASVKPPNKTLLDRRKGAKARDSVDIIIEEENSLKERKREGVMAKDELWHAAKS